MTPQEYRAIRRRLDLTQGELAARLGLSRYTVAAREVGRARITEEAALALRALAAEAGDQATAATAAP